MSRWQLTADDAAQLVAREPRMAPLVQHFGLLERSCYDDSFTGLVAIVLSQQLSDRAFTTCWAKLDPVLYQEPQQLLAHLSQGRYLPCTQGKRHALQTIATAFGRGELSHEQLLKWSKEERRAQLLAIKGLGPWSCDMFDLLVARERDCLLLGDLGVRCGLKLTLGLELAALPRKERRTMEAQLRAQFSPVGSFATFYLWAAAAAGWSADLISAANGSAKKPTSLRLPAENLGAGYLE